MKPTVHDIARTAGVSLATVDRVLNERPGVRAKTRDRVMEAMNTLGYVRDVGAANLARGRLYQFDFILPDNENTFMLSLRAELQSATERALAERVLVNVVLVPAFDEAALVAALDECASRKPDGVAFVAVDTDPVREACARLGEQGIHAVTLVSDLGHSTRTHYVGVDNGAAGRTAARLLGLFANGTEGALAVVAGSLKVRDHQERFDGFTAAMKADFPGREILPVLEGFDEGSRVEQLVGKLLDERSDIAGIYSLGAGNSGLVKALAEHTSNRPLVIAHERDSVTSKALTDGIIHAVLAQDAGHEIRSAIRVLKASADRLAIVPGQEHIRIEIFLKDNLPHFD
ncbi:MULTISPECIES: LacI family DNA-binding transcriptional regulator [Brucella/Ochrobactrum group]|jgi:LacI family transcriptional regulator|uniref:Regulatory protein LacI n=5 Tax=Pseudomonadota TaxID=1224 RepID=A6X4G5_BRUA4|nr:MULTISPECIES: LacI family DNA-binding transcriptional regulator [Brucella/Ochrobactrum group]MCR5942072.1 substrate-binding domain-containing protein [Ochrobactrum sp. XJ1]QTN05147.1 substrate-binding domain-containing protein [Ochrobactrum sp. EEELCW01]ABS16119.1 regulatory protein LacI [Brucella anthropi ATCC 49188]AIK41915.1 periplasmic binding s and sugar binding domain of LacI family protein [Brucella anthropi]EXL06315.1 LacI family transcriptional regulator [Brucella anthropi]